MPRSTRRGFDHVRLVPVFSRARQRVVDPRVATLTAQREVIEAKRRLAMWSVDNDVITTTQGWVPVEGNVGGWAPVADRPDVIVETAYPLFKLAPDPDQTGPRRPLRHDPVRPGPDDARRCRLGRAASPRRGQRLRDPLLRSPSQRRPLPWRTGVERADRGVPGRVAVRSGRVRLPGGRTSACPTSTIWRPRSPGRT